MIRQKDKQQGKDKEQGSFFIPDFYKGSSYDHAQLHESLGNQSGVFFVFGVCLFVCCFFCVCVFLNWGQ